MTVIVLLFIIYVIIVLLFIKIQVRLYQKSITVSLEEIAGVHRRFYPGQKHSLGILWYTVVIDTKQKS